MMWDLGGGVIVPGDAHPAPSPAHSYQHSYQRQSSYSSVPSPTSPTPFYPIVGTANGYSIPPPAIAPSQSYPTAYSQLPPTMPRGTQPEVRHGHQDYSHSRQHGNHSHSNRLHRVSMQVPQAAAQAHPGHFQYSRCTGKRKAVCIGINYTGTAEALRGCINDAKNVRKFLIHDCGYKEDDIVLLSDDAQDYRLIPTKQNIMNAMHWLVYNAKPHDALFFHYSGHGAQVPEVARRARLVVSPLEVPPYASRFPEWLREKKEGLWHRTMQSLGFSGHGNQIKDVDGDEKDGYDEVIFPVDFRQKGVITDDQMHALMVKPLPAGCRLTALFDSCHSGSILDLPYLYRPDGHRKGSQVAASHVKEKSTPADVISWSGCKDSQTSADTVEAGLAVGAMSYAFMKALRENPDQSYQQLLSSIRAILSSRYSQTPQLSSSHKINTSLKFVM